MILLIPYFVSVRLIHLYMLVASRAVYHAFELIISLVRFYTKCEIAIEHLVAIKNQIFYRAKIFQIQPDNNAFSQRVQSVK